MTWAPNAAQPSNWKSQYSRGRVGRGSVNKQSVTAILGPHIVIALPLGMVRKALTDGPGSGDMALTV